VSVDVTGVGPGSATITSGAVASANGGAGGTATATLVVRARPPQPNAPVVPQSATELALACSPSRLVLFSATRSGSRVRFRGVAAPADAGQRVIVRTVRGGAVSARATVRPDGSFETTGRVPARRALNRTRYHAELGERRSPALKLTRRLTAHVTAGAGTITIRGRVAPPLGEPVRPVVLRRVTSCGSGDVVVARVRPRANGRFRVSLPRIAGPALYRAHTRVPTSHAGGGTFETVTFVLGVDPAG
jgi:hypothetical protein